jgi:uncharacterized protein YkwD
VGSTVLIGAAPLANAATRHRRHKTVHHRSKSTATCANASASATSASVDTMRAAVVCLINQQRHQHGLPSLNASSQLNRSAQGWNNTLIATDTFTHGIGDAFSVRISATGYNWQSVGENIATGYPTPHAVVSAWMASPDHCRNILDPSFRDIGTGETPAGLPSQQSGAATWTQDFGLLMSQSPPSGNHGPQNGCPY